MRLTMVAAAAAGLLMLAPAQAQDDEGANCISGQSNMDACSSPNVRDADAKLNVVYRALRAKLSAADQVKVRDAERAWITFRDKECAFRTSSTVHGGNYTQQLSVCMAELTNQRLSDLNQIMSCHDDATACPWQGSN